MSPWNILCVFGTMMLIMAVNLPKRLLTLSNCLRKGKSRKKLTKQAEGAKKELDQSLQEAEDLNEQIREIQNDLKSKENLDLAGK